MDYVTELLDSGFKILVFAHHLEVMDKIEESVQKMKGKDKPGLIRIDGGVVMSKDKHWSDGVTRQMKERVYKCEDKRGDNGIEDRRRHKEGHKQNTIQSMLHHESQT